MEFTVVPFAVASVPLDELADEQFQAHLEALMADPRALGAGGVACDHERSRVSSTFQVKARAADEATRLAVAVYDDALATAGMPARTIGVSVVEGGNPELLP